MSAEGEKCSSLGDSARRIVAMVVVIGCHLGLLIQMLRPVIHEPDKVSFVENDPLVLKLRFIPPRRPAFTQTTAPARRPKASSLRFHVTLSGKAPEPPGETQPASTPLIPDHSADNQVSTSDGGFQERLRNARQADAIHGLPGSDMPSAPGIHLINPMSQGIGAVMRDTQRLFGITNRHCIDVDVWRHLTPQELSARHISLRDMEKIDDAYNCNRPMGLSF